MPPSKATRPAPALAECEPRKVDHAGQRDDRRDNPSHRAPQVARLYPDRRGERYDVHFNGELIVIRSRIPELDLARALLAKSNAGKVTVVDGVTGKPRSIIDIEKAAKLTVREDRRRGPVFVNWRPLPETLRQSDEGRAPTAETRSADTQPLLDHSGAQL